LGTEVVAALRVEQCVRVAERVDLVVTLFARAGEVEHDVEKRIEPALRCDAATAWTLRERLRVWHEDAPGVPRSRDLGRRHVLISGGLPHDERQAHPLEKL